MPIRLFGYVAGAGAERPSSLSEVTIVASAASLRRIAEFLQHAAAQLEQHGGRFGHEHLCDFSPGDDDDADVIVVGRVDEG